jgi:hypothetical protein
MYSRSLSVLGMTVFAPAVAGACATDPSTSPLRSEVTVSPSTVAPGASFTAHITVRNVSDRTLTFVGSSSCRATIEILRDGTMVGIGPFACTDDLSRFSLEPGEELTVDQPAAAVDLAENDLPAGTYEIRVVSEVAEPEVITAEGPPASLVVLPLGPEEAS